MLADLGPAVLKSSDNWLCSFDPNCSNRDLNTDFDAWICTEQGDTQIALSSDPLFSQHIHHLPTTHSKCMSFTLPTFSTIAW